MVKKKLDLPVGATKPQVALPYAPKVLSSLTPTQVIKEKI